MTQKMTVQTINNTTEKTNVMNEASTNSLPSKWAGHSPECSTTFTRMFGDIPGIFGNIPRNVWQHSLECLETFLRMFGNIPRNVWRYSGECLRTFPGVFGYISRNVWRYSPECWKRFLGKFEYILRNIWRHSPEYNIPLIPRVPRIPFSVPVFLVLYKAISGIIHSFPFSKNNILTE